MSPADLLHALNRKLAPDVVVRAAAPAPEGFDARRSARARRYRYLIWNSPVADPLLAPIAWHVPAPIDLRTVKGAADALIGEHDFRAFCRRPAGTEAGEPIMRRVTDMWVGEEPTDATGGVLLRLDIAAQSFCHQMVRSIAAVLVDVGTGRTTPAAVVELLRATDRSEAPEPAPPQGLCLVSVTY
jgi:tRNA pseudouridine38-40 synthase